MHVINIVCSQKDNFTKHVDFSELGPVNEASTLVCPISFSKGGKKQGTTTLKGSSLVCLL